MNLTIEIYRSGTTRILDVDNALKFARDVRFSTQYPGGLYSELSFFVARDVTKFWEVAGGQRIIVRAGIAVAWEGYIADITLTVAEGEQGFLIGAVGAWGALLMKRKWRKIWVDSRIDEQVWVLQTTSNQVDKFTVDRYNRLAGVPKEGVAIANNDGFSWRYTMPAGQTVKRITLNYNLQEAGQAWVLGIYNVDTTVTEWSVTASGSGSVDQTLATPAQAVDLFFMSQAVQTGVGDGTIYGKFTSIVVYGETGTINLEEITKDVIGQFTDLSSCTDFVRAAASALTLTSFVHDDLTGSLADLLTEAADLGDGSNRRWAASILSSEAPAAPDGKPALSIEQIPALDDYEYVVRIDETNLAQGFGLTRDTQSVINYVSVQYQNGYGITQFLTPADDSSLKDADSAALYTNGRWQEGTLDLGSSDAAGALAAGKTFLASNKTPRWNATGPITVIGRMRTKDGGVEQAALLRAGKRVKVENFVSEDVILMVTQTDYDAAADACTLNFGEVTQLVQPPVIVEMGADAPLGTPGVGAGGSTTAKKDRPHWWERMGYSKAEVMSWSAAERERRKQEWYARWRARHPK